MKDDDSPRPSGRACLDYLSGLLLEQQLSRPVDMCKPSGVEELIAESVRHYSRRYLEKPWLGRLRRLLEWPQRWLERHDARVVLTLAHGPLTGQELKARGVLSEWNCYSVLHSLEERGFLTSELADPEKPPQRVYRLKADG